MLRVASLTNRIFVASTLLAALSLGFAFYFVNAQVSAEAEADLRRGLTDAATLVDLRRQGQTETFATLARVIADVPKLKAAVDTRNPPTVQPLADEFRTLMGADLLVIADDHGTVLAGSGSEAPTLKLADAAPDSTEETFAFVPHARGVLQVITVPIVVLPEPVDVMGRMAVGFFMDDDMARRFREVTGADVAFAAGGRILASSLPKASRDALRGAMGPTDIAQVRLAGEEYVSLARPMNGGAAAPVTIVLRSRTERLRVLNTLRAGLGGALVVAVLLATLLSYFIARTVTRPLAAVTSAMRDVSATGDLTRKVSVRSRAWDDEDARLLTTAFNTLTESIARFQREAAQKERLSSLGRLSTVIAHEIRNPLMIIRASLSALRRQTVTSVELREAVADIDEETTRLNRIVSEVLDFAKPLRFELAPADVNDVCRASVAAAWTGASQSEVGLELDASLPPVVTDAERLRLALINILTNARHAVQAVSAAAMTGTDAPRLRSGQAVAVVSAPAVVVRTSRRGNSVSIAVQDRGTGIAADDLAHIFDPYFTTRRAGTGLGLPISRNIIEGLRGSIAVSSRRGEGTEVRIELPIDAGAGA